MRRFMFGIMYSIREESGFEIKLGLNIQFLRMIVINFVEIFRVLVFLNFSCIVCFLWEEVCIVSNVDCYVNVCFKLY